MWKEGGGVALYIMKWIECEELVEMSKLKASGPTRGDAILDLLVTNTSELISNIKIGGSLGCSDHAPVDFAVLRDMGQGNSKGRTLNFRKVKLQLFNELVNGTPWETALRDKGANRAGRSLRPLSIDCKSS
ncbi:nedd4-binding protein 2-like 2 [Limosa lapponica baueri]|uniref:Nedd4-binding protein 2-like 2 n=1 Tax=Limosa lapponica baueri TaxID=1758121 RepID=A0A2I0UU64_LIMLA|nr:nedd4-binding protein 2-like 2 [Limosa lapponica baueri]